MPNRLSQLRVVDPLLTTIARGFANEDYIGDNLFPIVPVEHSGGKIPKWGKEEFRVWNTKRALRAESNQMDGSWLETTPYQTQEHDLENPLDYQEIEEGNLVNIEARALNSVMNALALSKEVYQAKIAQDLANYPTSNKVTLSDDYFNEDAIDWVKIIFEKKAILASLIAKDANSLILPKAVWNTLRFHPIFKSYLITDSNTRVVPTIEDLKKILDIPNIYVGGARYTDDDVNFNYVWQNNIIIAYITPPSGIERTPYEPCYGYTLRKKDTPYSYKSQSRNGKITYVGGTDNYDVKIVGSESAYIINNPIDPSLF